MVTRYLFLDGRILSIHDRKLTPCNLLLSNGVLTGMGYCPDDDRTIKEISISDYIVIPTEASAGAVLSVLTQLAIHLEATNNQLDKDWFDSPLVKKLDIKSLSLREKPSFYICDTASQPVSIISTVQKGNYCKD